jgi:hypothetical protein
MAELAAFVRRFCSAIGDSQFVDPVVESFRGEPAGVSEAVAQ